MDEAVMDLASPDASPPTRIRSPICKSCSCAALAFLRFFSPGATRRIRVVAFTVTLISAPESGANVMTSLLMALIAPMRMVTALCPASPDTCCALRGSARQSVVDRSPETDKQHASACTEPFIAFIGQPSIYMPRGANPDDLQSFTQTAQRFTKAEIGVQSRRKKKENEGARMWVIRRPANFPRKAIARQPTAPGNGNPHSGPSRRLRSCCTYGCFPSKWFRLQQIGPLTPILVWSRAGSASSANASLCCAPRD